MKKSMIWECEIIDVMAKRAMRQIVYLIFLHEMRLGVFLLTKRPNVLVWNNINLSYH